MMRKHLARICSGTLALLMLAGCGGTSADTKTTVKLDPNNPTNITVWHYYNGAQQAAFDQLVEEFNRTAGKEEGIYVEAHSQGNVNDMQTKVKASFNKEVGSDPIPDVFASYADTAYAIEQMDMLVDLEQYMTQEELDEYVDSFVEEGRIGKNGELRIFPTAKSTEVFMMNATDWQTFADATGASLDDLSTIEGVVKTAQAYYEWTDAQTPDVPNDGKAFYGRDAVANLFVIGSMQLGTELFEAENGSVTVQADEDVMRHIWDNYYVPYVKGYFSAKGKFRSDDVATGDILAYTGSTASANYFPSTVETADGEKNIECTILPAPGFEGGEDYNVQQGAGMVVSKTDEQHEYASVQFLKWFTQEQNNLLFSSTAGYLPVKKNALTKDMLDEVIQKDNLELSENMYNTLTTSFDMAKNTKMYTNKPFEHGSEARNVLDKNLSDKAAADREQVEQLLAQGQSLEEATASYVSDEAFQSWLTAFREALDASVQ